MKIPLLLALTHLQALFNSLDPHSISQSLAFYELYGESKEGKEALARLDSLLGGDKFSLSDLTTSSKAGMEGIFSLVNPRGAASKGTLSKEELTLLQKLGAHLANRKLKGYYANTEEEVLALPPEEIDLARGLLLSQYGKCTEEVVYYEALIDLMALQVEADLPDSPTPAEKIATLNRFVFEKMRFRFPPHSIYAKNIDLYTFLPAVLDNHFGVCLGVTTLYIALAQRINLPLEIITPPGHIFVRYRDERCLINIETTARGIDVPTEKYLSINTFALQQRNLREVIGYTFVNQASVFLDQEDFPKTVETYEKAKKYLPNDILLDELLGYAYLFIGEIEKGKESLNRAFQGETYGVVVREPRGEDYLSEKADVEALKAVFASVDETRESILKKQEELQEVIKRYPSFRAAYEQLGASYLQLNRKKEALECFQHYHALDSNNPTIEYYLSVLYGMRQDYSSSWLHLQRAEEITSTKGFSPSALKELRRALTQKCPEIIS